MYIDKLPESFIYNDDIYYLILLKEDGMWTVSYCLIVDTDECSILMEYPPIFTFTSKKLRECVDNCLEQLEVKVSNPPPVQHFEDVMPQRTTETTNVN